MQPAAYFTFVLMVIMASITASLFGDDDDIGFTSGRVADSLWWHPSVSRRGVCLAWLAWLAIFVYAVASFDPIEGCWDTVAAIAVISGLGWHRLWHRRFALRSDNHDNKGQEGPNDDEKPER